MSNPHDQEPNLTGIPSAHANAVVALSNLGTTVVTEVGNLARRIGRIVGTIPEDAVGLVIGDPLHAMRAIAADWYDVRVQEIHERRRVKQTQPVSLSVALPLIRGAYDETREGLREMWAALIAAAMDPERASRVRVSFIETLRHFDPLDALVLRTRLDNQGGLSPTPQAFIAQRLGVTEIEVAVSMINLKDLKCIRIDMPQTGFAILPYGWELLRVCSD